MAIDAIVKPLLGIDLFRGLKPLQITEIARRADRIVYRPGDVIVSEDATGDAAILIIAGDARRVSGPGLSVDDMDAEPVVPGSLVAEMAMLVDTVHSSTVVAKSAVRALKISRFEMQEQMLEDPALAHHFMNRITGRLSQLAQDMRAIDSVLAESTARTQSASPAAQTLH